jgi:hypothetical protein
VWQCVRRRKVWRTQDEAADRITTLFIGHTQGLHSHATLNPAIYSTPYNILERKYRSKFHHKRRTKAFSSRIVIKPTRVLHNVAPSPSVIRRQKKGFAKGVQWLDAFQLVPCSNSPPFILEELARARHVRVRPSKRIHPRDNKEGCHGSWTTHPYAITPYRISFTVKPWGERRLHVR